MAVRSIDEFKKQFGIGKRRSKPLSDKELQDRKQTQLKALLATATTK
jgi:hypothetical protein